MQYVIKKALTLKLAPICFVPNKLLGEEKCDGSLSSSRFHSDGSGSIFSNHGMHLSFLLN